MDLLLHSPMGLILTGRGALPSTGTVTRGHVFLPTSRRESNVASTAAAADISAVPSAEKAPTTK